MVNKSQSFIYAMNTIFCTLGRDRAMRNIVFLTELISFALLIQIGFTRSLSKLCWPSVVCILCWYQCLDTSRGDDAIAISICWSRNQSKGESNIALALLLLHIIRSNLDACANRHTLGITGWFSNLHQIQVEMLFCVWRMKSTSILMHIVNPLRTPQVTTLFDSSTFRSLPKEQLSQSTKGNLMKKYLVIKVWIRQQKSNWCLRER